MRRANPSFTFALCASLMAHGLALAGLAWWYIQHNLNPKSPPLDRYLVMVQRMEQEQPKPKAPTPPREKKPPPRKKEEFEKPRPEMKDDSGEAHGAGTANRSTDGDKPMQAESGHEQADLMKAAQDIADDAFLPASAGKSEGAQSQPKKSPRAGEFAPRAVVDASTSSELTRTSPAAAPRLADAPGPYPKLDSPPQPAPVASGVRNPIPNAAVAQTATLNQQQKEIRGHKATLSDTESIAFAKASSAVFHAGRLQGRKGQKVKTTIPRFGLASEVDLQNLGSVRTIIGARVDDDGNVVEAQVLQTSGSDNIDEDCKLAVTNWTLEPQKDKDGHIISYLWTIAFE